MEKLMDFLVNSKKGQSLLLAIAVLIMSSSCLAITLSVPIFWMGHEEYVGTWMDTTAPYFFLPLLGSGLFFLSLFVPYLWFVSRSPNYEGDSRRLLKGMAIFCSIVPGGMVFSIIARELSIPHGIHNLAGMLIVGVIYISIISLILKRPFETIQKFVPLS